MRTRFSVPVQTSPGAHPASCTMGTGSFPGVKSSRGRLCPSPPSSSVVKEEYSNTCSPSMDHTAHTEPQCLYNSALYLYLYVYSLYGPYGLYRASVPVACTTLHFTFTYTFTPPMDHTACTEPQCLYNGALYFTLLHLHMAIFARHFSTSTLHVPPFLFNASN